MRLLNKSALNRDFWSRWWLNEDHLAEDTKPQRSRHLLPVLLRASNSTWQGGIIAGGKTYQVVAAVTGAVTAIGPGNTLTLNKAGFSIGETVTGPATTPATGTVASTDPAAKTMTLATSDESGTKRWIVNAGKTVVGPTGPATRFDAYLTWSGNQVTGLSTVDPGYFQAPPDLQLQFTDPAPSGQTWDQELPAGTTIQTRVKATNLSGEANSGWSNVVTHGSCGRVMHSLKLLRKPACGWPHLKTVLQFTKANKPWKNARLWPKSLRARASMPTSCWGSRPSEAAENRTEAWAA